MKHRTWMVGGMILGLAVLQLPQAYAFGGEWGGGKGGKGQGMTDEQRQEKMQQHWENLAQELGLSQEQMDQIKAHRESQKTEGKELFTEMKAKQEALKAVLENPEGTREEAYALSDEIAQLKTQKMRHRIDEIFEMKEILTPEQFQALQAKKQEMRKKHWKKGKKGEKEYPMRKKGQVTEEEVTETAETVTE